ncbi:hypothetical protein ACVGOW_17595 [Pseudonocardia saturnea]
MTDELASRDALRELLFDDVAPPPGSEAMFAATFAATGSEGAELLPPDDLFDDPVPGDETDDPGVDDGTLLDDPDPDTDVPDVLPVDAEHPADWSDPIPDPAPDHVVDPTHHGDPGTGW